MTMKTTNSEHYNYSNLSAYHNHKETNCCDTTKDGLLYYIFVYKNVPII